MIKKYLTVLLVLLPLWALCQEKLSKKELREQRKKEKAEKVFQDLVKSAQDSVWTFGSSENNMTSIDYGIFTLFKNKLTLEEVFIPNARNTNQDKRISTYIADVKSYHFEFDENLDVVAISMVFSHEGTNYKFDLKKNKAERKAIAEIRLGNNLLVTYRGRLR